MDGETDIAFRHIIASPFPICAAPLVMKVMPVIDVAYKRCIAYGRSNIFFLPLGRRMGLNIKNDETCRLAGELARLTGETMTGAITVALRERLEREKRERSAEALVREMRAIAERCAKLMGPGPSAVEIGEMLYDEQGLPK